MANEPKTDKKFTAEDVAHAYADMTHARGIVAGWERLAKVHRDALESHERELVKAKAEEQRLSAIFKKVAAGAEGI